jgi:competence ComEA-like helix-hairpin-helix protein
MLDRNILLVIGLCLSVLLPYQPKDFSKIGRETILEQKNILLGCSLNINTATIEELVQLPNIGESKAKKIQEERPFMKTKDILNVRGIGPGTYMKIQSYIRTKDEPCDFTF